MLEATAPTSPSLGGSPALPAAFRSVFSRRSLRSYHRFVKNLKPDRCHSFDHARNIPTSMPKADVDGVAPHFCPAFGHRSTPDGRQQRGPGIHGLYLAASF